MKDTVDARSALKVNGKEYQLWSLDSLGKDRVARLPYSLRILLENLLRHEDGVNVTRKDIDALLEWNPKAEPDTEIAFTPARVILQDFTGVPAVVDLAAMRDAVVKLGGRAEAINPLSPAELVIDHSVQVDSFGAADSLAKNNEIEFGRNQERYSFLRWGQNAFDNFKVVPPNTGIVHQVNLEYLARVVFDTEKDGTLIAYPDTLVGTDSHTTMINGLGVLGWGVGGIEAEAAMLGQPVTMLIPQVIGFRLTGSLAEGATATDLVLTVTEMLRKKGVVGKFVEFFGDGLSNLPLADRATLGNMSPEFGSTCAIFPIDAETVHYLKLSGRDPERIALVEAYARAQGLWREDGQAEAEYTDILELDMGDVKPSIAGPKRPQDRILLADAKAAFLKQLQPIEAARADSKGVAESRFVSEGGDGSVGNPATAPAPGLARVARGDEEFVVRDGAVLIAAITSCTNTSNPAVMLAAGLLARNAAAKGLKVKPWVKTSLAPGSRVVTEYLKKAELLDDLETLGFNVVGYGCTTCIGNSGPLPEDIAEAVTQHDIVGTSVLSGNRNFEGRIHPLVRMNYLASPPLVVAYALAGNLDVDLLNEPLGEGADGPVYLKDVWPSAHEVHDVILSSLDSSMFQGSYGHVFDGDANWRGLSVPEGEIYDWPEASTYVRNPPYFVGMGMTPEPVQPIKGARALAVLGDSVTTDHISPAGSIASNSPAAKYLVGKGVDPNDFNSYGSRRGNHEVMMRGTFANIRLRNALAGGVEGGWTRYLPSGEIMAIYDAAMRYQQDGTPLVILAGKEYGSGSSRDWAAKGTKLLGVRAVIAESYERIHRSNLIGMGVLPLQFNEGDSAASLGLDGTETFTIDGLGDGSAREVTVTATREGGKDIVFTARVRIDTPKEREYYQNGGILHYVLRQLASADQAA
ncbi:aconitate hydratase AcnA [Thioalkalivibrio sp. XN279]|uniref:aconitate hydratase AcnA n=1 Tax=Thioalkalivibrio sp. XN279 TaxID=2714953 RepID=UPI00140C447F|nr:aconitate hydratase AcnA [Thioalkalivibrio sp. XN279]NHA14389.1 aconitate hydratase AcnA [Thioalkalivibrio sp. XN279]